MNGGNTQVAESLKPSSQFDIIRSAWKSKSSKENMLYAVTRVPSWDPPRSAGNCRNIHGENCRVWMSLPESQSNQPSNPLVRALCPALSHRARFPQNMPQWSANDRPRSVAGRAPTTPTTLLKRRAKSVQAVLSPPRNSIVFGSCRRPP